MVSCHSTAALCSCTLQQQLQQARKHGTFTLTRALTVNLIPTRSSCIQPHLQSCHVLVSIAGEYPRRVIMSCHATAAHRSHRLPLSTPYPVFWAASWVYAVAERIAAMKPAPMRIAELSNHYITSQASDTNMQLGIVQTCGHSPVIQAAGSGERVWVEAPRGGPRTQASSCAVSTSAAATAVAGWLAYSRFAGWLAFPLSPRPHAQTHLL